MKLHEPSVSVRCARTWVGRYRKHARSFDGFDEQILALHAGGMITREIQRHLREVLPGSVSIVLR